MPARTNTAAHKYNRPITILAPTISGDDGQGGPVETFTSYYKCWADMDSFAKGRGLSRPFLYMQLYPTATRTIAIRWQASSPIDASMRVQYVKGVKTHIYQIVGVDNFKEANVEIVLFCTELQAKGSS
jgi:SPP1 family predicted phage head-tail adaptor